MDQKVSMPESPAARKTLWFHSRCYRVNTLFKKNRAAESTAARYMFAEWNA